ncbi:MAG: hypothetical protein V1754_11130 [Pseudomonadota bacterium]
MPAERPPEKETRKQRTGTVPLFGVLLLVLIVAWEVRATLLQHSSVPSDGNWRAAAAKVNSKRDLAREPILFAPHWVEPIGLHHLGDKITLKMATLSDVDQFNRIWEVSVRGARHPWLKDKKPVSSWQFGGVRVAMFEQKAKEVLHDFYENILAAKVERIGNSRMTCGRQDNRFVCDHRRGWGWNWVGAYQAEVGHRPYHCIYAHPVDGARLKISFPAVPIGKQLVGYTGIDDFENRKRADAPVSLEVFIAGKSFGAVDHKNEWPWHRFEFDTSAMDGQKLPVSFEITAKRAYARVFCFKADTRR